MTTVQGQQRAPVESLAERTDKDLTLEYLDARRRELHRRQIRRELDAAEYQEACGERKDVSFAALAQQPRPPWVMDGILTQGIYGLAGPPEAGKSLLMRDWLCQVAASGRNVLYAISEGQHDVHERFAASHLYWAAEPFLWLFDGPLNLGHPDDREWMIKQYASRQPALIVFDMIYGFGLPDDNATGDVAPVLGGCKRLASQLGACVLITGHPGHGGQRRFRGSSMWRGAFDGEFHMADGTFSCEKHKYADKKPISWGYTVEYPYLRWLGDLEGATRMMDRLAVIGEDFRIHPGGSERDRASRLAPQMGLTGERVRQLIRDWKKSKNG